MNSIARLFSRRVAVAAGVVALAAGITAPAVLGSSHQKAQSRPGFTGKVQNLVLSDTANGNSASFAIELKAQADISKAYTMKDQNARGRYVYKTLKAEAARTQAPLKAYLDSQGVNYRSFWVANVIFVHAGTRALVENLADRADVKQIEANDASYWLNDMAPQLNPVAALAPSGQESPSTVEWNVNMVHAPQVWAQGFTGQGMVVSNQDTGMRWTHQALKPHYRGWNGSAADHNYNWHDSIHSDISGNGSNPCGFNSVQPCDDNAHGTHTTGTTVGADSDNGGVNEIGVAPGAKWIGCHNMDEGVGRPETYTECFQFFIAPTDLNGQNPDPTKRPDVMNNSWGCPTTELCAPDTLQQIVENTQAAGIFVEVSAGNGGSACSTVNDPPAIYGASFSTAAINSSMALAGFSSRGPVTVDGSNRLKPDIAAPGVNVRSSINTSDTSYQGAGWQGTSMAGPHVVGVVALLWSAIPSMERDVAGTKQLIENTANPNVSAGTQVCGGTGAADIPNNLFGYGLVDALAAYNGGGPPPGWTTVTPIGIDEFGGSSTSDGTYTYEFGGHAFSLRRRTRGRRSRRCRTTRR